MADSEQYDWELPVVAAIGKWSSALGESLNVPWKSPIPPSFRQATKELSSILEATIGARFAEPFTAVCDCLAKLHRKSTGAPTADEVEELKTLLSKSRVAVSLIEFRGRLEGANERLNDFGAPIPQKIEDWLKLGKPLDIPSLEHKTAADIVAEVESFADEEQWDQWEKRIKAVRSRSEGEPTHPAEATAEAGETANVRADTQMFFEAAKKVRCELTQQLLFAQYHGLKNGRTIPQVNDEFRRTNERKLGKTVSEREQKWDAISKRARTVIKPFK